jgi:hypothetical protein
MFGIHITKSSFKFGIISNNMLRSSLVLFSGIILLGVGCNFDATSTIKKQQEEIDHLTKIIQEQTSPTKSSESKIDDKIYKVSPVEPNQDLRVAYEESSRHSAIADIAEFSCLPDSRFDCAGGSCTSVSPASYFFVDYGVETGTYFRCDTKGCDSYPVEVNHSGEFTQFIPSQGQAMLIKIATGDILGNKGDFVDIVTLGTGAIISTGRCEFSK